MRITYGPFPRPWKMLGVAAGLLLIIVGTEPLFGQASGYSLNCERDGEKAECVFSNRHFFIATSHVEFSAGSVKQVYDHGWSRGSAVHIELEPDDEIEIEGGDANDTDRILEFLSGGVDELHLSSLPIVPLLFLLMVIILPGGIVWSVCRRPTSIDLVVEGGEPLLVIQRWGRLPLRKRTIGLQGIEKVRVVLAMGRAFLLDEQPTGTISLIDEYESIVPITKMAMFGPDHHVAVAKQLADQIGCELERFGDDDQA